MIMLVMPNSDRFCILSISKYSVKFIALLVYFHSLVYNLLKLFFFLVDNYQEFVS